MHPYDVIFVGLALDVVGAVVLAKGFMLKNHMDIFFESLTIVNGNDHLAKSTFIQRSEAKVGAVFLVLGFLCQIWGNLHGGIAATEPGWIDSIPKMLCAGAGVAGIGALAVSAAHRRARARFYRLLFHDYSLEKPLSNHPTDRTWLSRWSRLIDVRRKRNETEDAFLERLQQRHAHLGQLYGKRFDPS